MDAVETLDYQAFDRRNGYNREQDKNLLVRFFMHPRKDKEASEKEGRPIYKDVEHIDIKIVGNRNAGACRPATEMDRRRFPDHYRAFKDRTSAPEDMGTPLTEWPPCSRSMAEELAFFNVKTVEQLAVMADSQVGQFRGLFSMKEKAKKWLEAVEKEKPISDLQKQLDQLAKENEELRIAMQRVLEAHEGEEVETLNEAQQKRAKTRAVKAAKEA